MSGPVRPSAAGAPASPGTPPLPLEQARLILEETLAASAAEHTEAVLEARHHSLTRFANNEIHQNVTSLDHVLTVRVQVGRRAGSSTTNRLDSTSLRQAAERALTLARLSPEDPGMPEFAPPAEYTPLDAFAPATAASTPEERASSVGPVMRAARAAGLNAAGAFSTEATTIAIANTGGLYACQSETHAQFTCTVRGPDSSGWVDRHRRDVRDIDCAALGEIAAGKAARSKAPGAIEPGPITVILEPSAVAELIAFLADSGLGAQAGIEGRSFMQDQAGRLITGEHATVSDEPYDPRAFGRPFDIEGTPRRRVVGIERGVAGDVVHDRRTALKLGTRSTGHATPAPSTDGPLPFSLVLAGGDQSVEQMIASTERGVLVTRFWYCRVVDSKKTLVTGMTRDGTFLIERGRVTRGLRNLRFNDSVLGVLERAEGFGNDAEPTVFDYIGNCVVAPSLKVRDFRFTGVSPF